MVRFLDYDIDEVPFRTRLFKNGIATLFTLSNIAVRVYANDHLPPHFHVTTPDREALVLIADLTILRGEMSAADRKKVWPWIVANASALADEWNRINPRFPIA